LVVASASLAMRGHTDHGADGRVLVDGVGRAFVSTGVVTSYSSTSLTAIVNTWSASNRRCWWRAP
jgi:hypothetical protein